MKQSSPVSRGFTLVEILIVVVILGILSATVVPAFGGVTDDSRQGAFIASINGMVEACDMYRAQNGEYPADTSSGVFPAELASILQTSDFEGGTVQELRRRAPGARVLVVSMQQAWPDALRDEDRGRAQVRVERVESGGEVGDEACVAKEVGFGGEPRLALGDA